jgi:hypothetical protein
MKPEFEGEIKGFSTQELCQHQSDGHFYSFTDSKKVGFNKKCKKCEEFY